MIRWAALACVLVGCGDNHAPQAIDVATAFDALDALLAATPAQGRVPGTNQAIAELVRDQLRGVGVADVAIERFAIPVSTAASHRLAFAGAPRDHAVNVFGGAGAIADAPVGDAGLASTSDPALAGKVALIDFSVTRSLRTQYKNVIASGAVGAVIDAKLDVLRQRNVWTLAGASAIAGPIPIVTITGGDAASLRADLAAGRDVRVELASDTAVATQQAYNVVARIPGTAVPDRVLVIDAHLDSWFRGAADDAQAVAALVALAEHLVAHPLPFTVELVAFDGEETFLLGSNDYARRRLAQRARWIGAISLEMLAPRRPGLAILTLDDRDAWLPAAQAGGLTEVFPILFTPRDLMTAFDGEVPSDQGTFWQLGVPGMLLVTSYDEYHSARDDAANTDELRYAEVLGALARTVDALAAQPLAALSRPPASYIDLAAAITARTPTRIEGAVTAPRDAALTATLFDAGYTAVEAAAPIIGGAFALDHDFADGAEHVLAIDAAVPGQAAGRALLRISPEAP